MDDPNKVQHGGDHYKKAEIQHWDMMAEVGCGWEYYIGCATKYLTRVKDVENDPKKALHYVDKLIWLTQRGKVPLLFKSTQGLRKGVDEDYAVRGNKLVDMDEFLGWYFTANDLDPDGDKAKAISLLLKAFTVGDLRNARKYVAKVAGMP